MNTRSIAASALLTALSLTLIASPASAATLPVDDHIYVLPCGSRSTYAYLYEVDPTTGVESRVGSAGNDDALDCSAPGAYDVTSGLGYWISWAPPYALASVDLETGVTHRIGTFLSNGDEPDMTAIAIDRDGNAFALSADVPDFLYSLDLSTGAMTPIGMTGLTGTTYGLSYDPVTDEIYAYNRSTHTVYSVNTATGAFTQLATGALPGFSPWGTAFDSAGNLWAVSPGRLISAPLDDPTDVEELTTTGGAGYFSIIIAWGSLPDRPEGPVTPATPELAETGIDGGARGCSRASRCSWL